MSLNGGCLYLPTYIRNLFFLSLDTVRGMCNNAMHNPEWSVLEDINCQSLIKVVLSVILSIMR